MGVPPPAVIDRDYARLAHAVCGGLHARLRRHDDFHRRNLRLKTDKRLSRVPLPKSRTNCDEIESPVGLRRCKSKGSRTIEGEDEHTDGLSVTGRS